MAQLVIPSTREWGAVYQKMYSVYIIQSIKSGRFYIGYTNNLKKRLKYHNSGFNQSTKGKGPWKIVYWEVFSNKTTALKREKFLKKQKNRQFYQRLITGIGAIG